MRDHSEVRRSITGSQQGLLVEASTSRKHNGWLPWLAVCECGVLWCVAGDVFWLVVILVIVTLHSFGILGEVARTDAGAVDQVEDGLGDVQADA